MMFLSENVDLLGTIVDLSAALVKLALKGDVFGLQLLVLLLQQRQTLLLLRTRLLERLIHCR
jgi:hypothetical protein